MRLGGKMGHSILGLQLGVALALSGCNTVAGAVDGLGRQFSAIMDWARPYPSGFDSTDFAKKAGTTIDMRAGAAIASQRTKRLLWPEAGEPVSSSTPASNRERDRGETLPEKSTTTTGQGGPKIALAAVASTTPSGDEPVRNFRVQVAAVRDEADADKAWRRAQFNHGPVLANMEPHVVRAETSRGVIYRIQTGSFQTRSAADHFCLRLQERGAICIVVAA